MYGIVHRLCPDPSTTSYKRQQNDATAVVPGNGSRSMSATTSLGTSSTTRLFSGHRHSSIADQDTGWQMKIFKSFVSVYKLYILYTLWIRDQNEEFTQWHYNLILSYTGLSLVVKQLSSRNSVVSFIKSTSHNRFAHQHEHHSR